MVRDHCYPKCGDGVRVPFEGCDDGNTQDLSCALRLDLAVAPVSCMDLTFTWSRTEMDARQHVA